MDETQIVEMLKEHESRSQRRYESLKAEICGKGDGKMGEGILDKVNVNVGGGDGGGAGGMAALVAALGGRNQGNDNAALIAALGNRNDDSANWAPMLAMMNRRDEQHMAHRTTRPFGSRRSWRRHLRRWRG